MKRLLLILSLYLSIGAGAQLPQQLFWAQNGSYDPDAQAFIMAAAISSGSQQQAINTMVINLKANGLWSVWAAAYPIAGSAAANHKYNLVDPRDLDAAFRLVFVATTHDATGVDFDGSTSWARTFYKTSLLSGTEPGLVFYSAENTATTNGIDIGYALNINDRFVLTAGETSTSTPMAGISNPLLYGTTNAQGLFVATRTAGSTSLYRNGIQLGTVNTSFTTSVSDGVNIGRAGGVNSAYSNRKCIFAGILKTGLTPAQVATLSAIINAYETALSRNTY